jgi:putative spermidine/putrescine transport system permease protein
MRRLGRLVLVPIAALTFAAAFIPLFACILLGAPGLEPSAAEPALMAACLRSLLLAAAAVAIGWPAGVVAALAIWASPKACRRLVLGASLVVLLLPASLTAPGLGRLADLAAVSDARLAAVLAGHAAPASAIVLLVMTGALNRLDPTLMRSAAACGATRGQTWRLGLLPPLAGALALAAAAAFAFSLTQTRLDHLLLAGHPTLAALLDAATSEGDVATAPEALLLAILVTLPLIPLALVAALRFRPAYR